MLELCLKYNVILVSDEIYRDIIFKDYRFVFLWNVYLEIYKNSIICVFFNKGFNLGGLKILYVLIRDVKIREILLERLKSNLIIFLNVFVILVIVVVYNESEEWLDVMISYVEENFEIVYDFFEINILKVKVMKLDFFFLVWIDVREVFRNEEEFKEFFRYVNLIMVVGSYFVKDGDGFICINVGCFREILNEVLNRIKKMYISMYC